MLVIPLLLGAAPLDRHQDPSGGSWREQVVERLEDEEYLFTRASDGPWSAPNRAQGFRTRADEDGIELTSRVYGAKEEDGGWRLRLTVSALGRSGFLQTLPKTGSEMLGGRLVHTRALITDWYVNAQRGLEQGFTISVPPESTETASALVLELRVEGGLRARISNDGKEVLFGTGAGIDVVRYADLRVADALGTEVGASFSLEPGRLLIHFDDGDAAYPLTVDSLLTSPAWTAESNQANAQFGTVVATAGDVNGDGFSDLLVGAPLFDNGQTDEGRAFLFLGSASGPGAAPAWTAESDQASAQFGASAAAAGDVNGDGYGDVIVGAPLYDNGQTDEGRASVYLGSATGLSSTPALVVESNQASAQFGLSVACAGDVNGDGFDDVLVGAPLYDNGQTDEGRAFLFKGSALPLATAPAWTAESNQASAEFGWSVSGAGDANGDGRADAIVGAPLYDNGQTNEGRVFLYFGTASGLGAAASWTAESDQANAEFGDAVGGAGDVNGDGYADVIVGAHLFDSGQTDEGRAFLYPGSASGPAAAASWTAEADLAGAEFGSSVATAGDINGDGYSDVIVGAPLYKNGQRDEGRAFSYLGAASGLSAQASWTAESDQADAHFGVSVAAAGDVNGDGFGDVIVGSPFFANGQTDEGRAFLYYGSAASLSTNAVWTTEGGQTSAAMGYSAGPAGDVNGDGFADVFVGVPFYDNGQGIDAGKLLVFYGSATGLASVPNWTADGDQAGSLFAYSAAKAGDVNGDGYTDLIVGAYKYDNGQTDEGRAYLYLGSAAGLATSPAWIAESNQAGAQFGNSVSSAGDVNGDGYGDVAIGGYAYDHGELDEGRAFLYLGSPAGLGATPAWTAEGDQAGASFGAPVASAGDVNRDGFSDVLVGAWRYANGESLEGRAYLYLGSRFGLSAAPAWTAESNQADALFGFPLTGAGDVNGDGFSDVLVGATAYDNGQVDEGRVYLYLGSASGLSAAPFWTFESNQEGAALGYAVAPGGDVNGDGFADILVGAPYYDNLSGDEGRAYLFLGSATGPGAAPAWTADGGQELARFSYSSGGAGDVNGDGFGDIIVGANGYDSSPSLSNEGRAVLYYGNGGAGSAKIPRQRRGDASAPIDVLGRAEPGLTFRLTALGRTAAGRGRVRLESEVKALGVPFDTTGTQKTAWADTGAPGGSGSAAALDQLWSGLGAGVSYRWRVRFLTGSPFFPRSPWFFLSHNSAGETDLRSPICRDADGDGFGVPGDPVCPAGPAVDCNDANPTIHPNAPETCDNVDNNCDGTIDGVPTTCGVGACARTGVCTAGQNSCAPGTPSTELCDSVDNNCDGTIDGFPTSCGVGGCARTGTCVAGIDNCAAGSPSPEVCDNVDNNCDGTVDSVPTTCGLGACARTGFCTAGQDSCAPGTPSTELCDNVDNNCDGTVDGFPTSCGIGGCARTGTCVAGIDNCVAGSPSPEVCDNVDNNCDGTVDSLPTACGLGPCARTGYCTAGQDSCAPGTPSTELCDGVDNNCDGTVDSFPTSCGVGGCARTGTCVAGIDNCVAGSPSPEVCDDIDNNCDGAVDNVPPPAGSLVLSVDKISLSWTEISGEHGYDVVRGSLQTLQSGRGNFAASTDLCIDNNSHQTSISYETNPAVGEGSWILVRGNSTVCGGGRSTYDTGAPSQTGSRDAGIAASPSACP